MATLKHEVGGYVRDYTREKISRILKIKEHEMNTQFGERKRMFSLVFEEDGFTHYLTVIELDEIFPYVGKDLEIIKVLYVK